jgi:hypothetical protein
MQGFRYDQIRKQIQDTCISLFSGIYSTCLARRYAATFDSNISVLGRCGHQHGHIIGVRLNCLCRAYGRFLCVLRCMRRRESRSATATM